MALDPCQVQLSRASGSLLMGPGTPYTVLPEFDPWSKTNRAPQSEPRSHAHGSLLGTEWVDEVVVLLPLSVYRNGAATSEWMTAHDDLAAAFAGVGASGELCELSFEWGGREFVMFGRPRQVQVSSENASVGKSVAQCAFVAADPRRYSASLTSLSTGLAVQSGGLTLPLTMPFTIDGVLTGGEVTIPNGGSTDLPITVRIDGPVVEPGVVVRLDDGPVQVRFDLTLRSGQWLEISSVNRQALLNGLESSNQRPRAVVWDLPKFPIPPGGADVRFTAGVYDPAAEMTVDARAAAWW